ncbi:hypothetical protein ACF0H5_019305 [Mactra antiquata]
MAGRGKWKNQYEFIFSCIGCLVGLGNIWRFPYLCYKNGGGAFLVPYFVFMILCAIPIFFLEMAYTQFSNLGPGKAWICVPLFRGVGFGMVAMTSIVAIYYTVIMAWTLYYFVMSFSSRLPWSHCENSWNTDACYSRVVPFYSLSNVNVTDANYTMNASYIVPKATTGNSTIERKTSSEEFWERNVLQLTSGIQEPGNLRWQLVLALLAAWLVVFLCLIKGVKSSGKVMYVAATMPYLLLLVLLIRGCTLDGALDGFLFYAVPKWEKLGEFSVWGEAAVQIFYSAGLGWGGISTLASFNDFHNNVLKDAIILPILDGLTSFFAGCVIFVNLGYMAHSANLPIEDVVSQGPGIAFMVYPEALAQLPLPQLWSVLFFVMLFVVGLDSQIVHVQTITSAFIDSFPKQLMKRKLQVTAVTCLILFVLGLSCVTQGGVYVLQILDWYCASIAVMFLALSEVVGLAWVYGIRRFYSDIELMLGHRLSPIWRIFWQFITPGIIMFVWVFNLGQLSPVTYGTVTYPTWSLAVGWVISFFSLVPFPVCVCRELMKAEGNTLIEKLRQSIKPSDDWKPANPDLINEYDKMISMKKDRNVFPKV